MMAGYIVLTLGVALFLLVPLNSSDRRIRLSKKVSKRIVLLFFIFLFIWSALKGDITVDALGYRQRYNRIIKGLNNNIEYVFRIINLIAYYLFHDFQGVIIITTAIFLGSIYFYGKEYSENIQYTVFLFFIYGLFFRGINQVRQYTAISFFVIGLIFFNKKKLWLSLLFTVIAALTHSVCVLLFVLYPLSLVRISKRTYIGVLLCSPILFTIARSVIAWLFTNIGSGQFAYYITGGRYDTLEKLVQPILKTWGLSFFYIMTWDDIQKKDQSNIYVNCLLIASVCSIFGNLTSEMVRVVEMFILPEIFFIPTVVKSIRKNYILYIIWAAYLIGLGILVYHYSIIPWSEYPYIIAEYFTR